MFGASFINSFPEAAFSLRQHFGKGMVTRENRFSLPFVQRGYLSPPADSCMVIAADLCNLGP